VDCGRDSTTDDVAGTIHVLIACTTIKDVPSSHSPCVLVLAAFQAEFGGISCVCDLIDYNRTKISIVPDLNIANEFLSPQVRNKNWYAIA
jgi:hypothetical protein